jgi:hypothetical protein
MHLNAHIFASDIPAAYLNADLDEKKAILFSRTDTIIIIKHVSQPVLFN